MAKEVRDIRVRLDTEGARAMREAAAALGLVNKNTKSLAGNMGFLTRAFQGWLGIQGLSKFTSMSDEVQNISNRMKIVTGTAEGASAALQELAGIAERTNQGIGAVGEIYSRMAISLRAAKLSTAELSTLTESLINTFRVAGATTTETTNTIIQLSQAFASGELRGQELRSVMEQNATLAGALRDRFGGDIYKKAQQGLITVVAVMETLRDMQIETNREAAKLSPTFEQTLTKSMNKLALSINNLNKEFDLSGKFAKVMEIAVNHLGDALVALGAGALVYVVIQFQYLTTAIKAMTAASWAFVASNPLLLGFTAIAAAGVIVWRNWDSLMNKLREFRVVVLEFTADAEESFLRLRKNFLSERLFKQAEERINSLKETARKARESLERGRPESGNFMGPLPQSEEERSVANMNAAIEKYKANMKTVAPDEEKWRKRLAALNRELFAGRITLEEYNRELVNVEIYKINQQFKEGRTDVFKYHEELRKLEIKDLTRDLEQGRIALGQYKQAVGSLKEAGLREQLAGGRIELEEFNQKLTEIDDKIRWGAGFSTGVSNVIKQMGTLSQGVASSIETVFNHLETGFLDFIKTGKFEFSKFASAIMDDLNKIIYRALIFKPLAEGLLSFATPAQFNFAGGSGGSGMGGGIGQSPYAFAKGGVVDSPTGFMFGGGKRGIAGESGPEAILPLQRSSSGDLGVSATVSPVTINILNQSGADVQQVERQGPGGERQIDIIIAARVREGIVTGKFDTAMKSAFGVRRKGS